MTVPIALPLPLPQTPRREALGAMGGYDYQVWTSIETWLSLTEDHEVLYLEGAEDIDRASPLETTTIQVKRTEETISLNTNRAREALRNYWATREKSPGRLVKYCYWTTSLIAKENNSVFGELTGIDAWHKAVFDENLAEMLRKYLIINLPATGTLLSFLNEASTKQLQSELFNGIIWSTGQPEAAIVEENVTNRLEERLSSMKLSKSVARQVKDRLYKHCWSQVLRPAPSDRNLTVKSLDAQIAEATTLHLAIPVSSAQTLIYAALSLPSMQNRMSPLLLEQEPPPLPNPLLERKGLVDLVAKLVTRREAILLTGSVYKGKTTIAQLAAISSGLPTRWIDLTGREPAALTDIFNLVNAALDRNAPGLLVLDDLNTSATVRRAYARSLQQLVHRAALSGTALLITAQGQSEALDTEIATEWRIKTIDIPPLNLEEAVQYCLSKRCPSVEVANAWSKLVVAQTGGHPKLVQVRLEELADAGWPEFAGKSMLGESVACTSVKQVARELLAYSEPPAVNEFALEAGEFVIAPTKEMLLHLAELPIKLIGASAVLARLQGRWLEALPNERFRVTPIIRAEIGDTWTKERQMKVNAKIFDAMYMSSLTPSDVAALVLHAFVAKDSERMALAIKAVFSCAEDVAERIYPHLDWLAYMGVRSDQTFRQFGSISSMLRLLQFKVASQERPAALEAIVSAWHKEIDLLSASDQSETVNQRSLYNLSVLLSQAALPISVILNAATSVYYNPPLIGERRELDIYAICKKEAFLKKAPASASLFQIVLALRAGTAGTPSELKSMVDWVALQSDPELLSQFNDLFSWDVVRGLGAFIHRGWAKEAELDKPDWGSWLQALKFAEDTAASRNLSGFGEQVARAKSIILAEYLQNASAALAALEQAESNFGASQVLLEQRVNVLFRTERYEDAMSAWELLLKNFGAAMVRNPFVFRQAAIVAGKLEKFALAADYFERGANETAPQTSLPLRCGLLADASYAAFKAGQIRRASSLLTLAVLAMPKAAYADTDNKWQAAVQVMNTIALIQAGSTCRQPNGDFLEVSLGKTSEPNLIVESLKSGQEIRVQLLITQTGYIEARWRDADSVLMLELKNLTKDASALVRMEALKALILHTVVVESGPEFVNYVHELVRDFGNLMDTAQRKEP